MSVVPVWVQSLEIQASWCSSLIADRLKTQEELVNSAPVVWLEEFPHYRRVSLFVLFRPSPDQRRPTRTGEGNLLLSRLISSKDTLTDALKSHVWANIWASQIPVRLTHEISHHSGRAVFCKAESGSRCQGPMQGPRVNLANTGNPSFRTGTQPRDPRVWNMPQPQALCPEPHLDTREDPLGLNCLLLWLVPL